MKRIVVNIAVIAAVVACIVGTCLSFYLLFTAGASLFENDLRIVQTIYGG